MPSKRSSSQPGLMVLDEAFDTWVSRPLAERMAPGFKRLGFSADTVSVIAMLCGISAGVCFTQAGYWPLLGGFLLSAMVVIDCADGAVARLNPPSDKPWRGRMFDGMADLGTLLSIHVAMVLTLSDGRLNIQGHTFGLVEALALVLLGFVSFSWKSSVLDDVKQRLKPNSVDRDLARYADQKKTLFERFLYFSLVNYVKQAEKLTGHGRPGGYDVFQQTAIVGPTHHLIAMAIAGSLQPWFPLSFLGYLLLTLIPGNAYLWFVLYRARQAATAA